MISILDRKFHEYYRPEDEAAMEYHKMRDACALKYVNDFFEAKGYISIEKIGEIFDFEVPPNIIEETSVLRYDGKKLDLVKEPIGCWRYKFYFKLEDKQ